MMPGVDDELAETAMSELHRAGLWLEDELREPALERGCLTSDLEPTILRSILIRRVPELIAMTAKTLLNAPRRDWYMLVEYFVDHCMLHLPALATLERDFERLWLEYLPHLEMWLNWEMVDESEGCENDFKIQIFRHPSDGKYAADFVTLIPWSHSWEEPEALVLALQRDFEAAHQALENEFDMNYLGLRCLRPSVGAIDEFWKPGWFTDEDELPEPHRQYAQSGPSGDRSAIMKPVAAAGEHAPHMPVMRA